MCLIMPFKLKKGLQYYISLLGIKYFIFNINDIFLIRRCERRKGEEIDAFQQFTAPMGPALQARESA